MDWITAMTNRIHICTFIGKCETVHCTYLFGAAPSLE